MKVKFTGIFGSVEPFHGTECRQEAITCMPEISASKTIFFPSPLFDGWHYHIVSSK